MTAPATTVDDRGVVALLAAQALAFGLTVGFLVIAANAIFLDAYGSEWLPITYLGIAAAGLLASGTIARTVRRWPLPQVATVTIGVSAALLALSWIVIVAAAGVWVSGPLLVMFPVSLQIGFVFVGGQAGRLLDVGGIKAKFPRIVSGFAIGFLLSGLLASPLLALTGRVADLLVVAAGTEAVFAVLLVVTARRFADRLGRVDSPVSDGPRPPLSRLLSARFVVLIMGYQVLSAFGSQLLDFLLFDRAASRYSDPEDLARFVAQFTALVNLVDVLFLAFVAGGLLRRFGLRFGIPANPAAVTFIAMGMMAAVLVGGAGSLGLFVVVIAARITDIALTDGTTRTSINATYQVLPVEERLAVQASVEGVGVPVAIGATGVLLLVFNALGSPLGWTIAVTVATCAAWTVISVVLYREYTGALVGALRRPSRVGAHLDPWDAESSAAIARLLASDDGSDVRLGLDLVAGSSSPATPTELARLADDPRPDVAAAALTRLADDGDAAARARLSRMIGTWTASSERSQRLLAAHTLAASHSVERGALGPLVVDDDSRVRVAALEAIGPGDVDRLDDVLEALGRPSSAGAAVGALERLGDAALPALREALAHSSNPVAPATARLVRAARTASIEPLAATLAPYLEHPDRSFGLTILETLALAGADPGPLRTTLERLLVADAEHTARCLATLLAVEPGPSLERALRDELELLRRRVLAELTVLYGRVTMEPVALTLEGPDDGRRSLALELLEVRLGHRRAALVLPVLAVDLDDEVRTARLGSVVNLPVRDRAGALADLVGDPDHTWRSSWVQACAAHEAATI